MPKFLIDNNLPNSFDIWKSEDFLYVRDLDPKASDTIIWNLARAQSLTIVSKDSDFTDRILLSEPPPRVIHLRTGNMSIREFFNFYTKNWTDIVEYSERCKLVTVSRTQIAGIV